MTCRVQKAVVIVTSSGVAITLTGVRERSMPAKRLSGKLGGPAVSSWEGDGAGASGTGEIGITEGTRKNNRKS